MMTSVHNLAHLSRPFSKKLSTFCRTNGVPERYYYGQRCPGARVGGNIVPKGARLNARKAFEKAYEAHKDRLLTLATALTGELTAAEDIVHDVFASLVAEPSRLRKSTNLPGYLAVCVRNRAYDWYRKMKRDDVHAGEILARERHTVSDDPTAQAEQVEEQEVLLGMVGRLPQELREVLSLRIWGNLTFDEIAAAQNTSKSTAHERYRRALQELRTQFTKGT